MTKLLGTFLLTLLCIITNAHAAELSPVDIGKSAHQIGFHIDFYEDKHQQFDFEHIADIPQDLFKPLDKAICARLFTNSTYYFKFRAQNDSDHAVSRVITFGTPWLDHIKLKIISPNREAAVYKTGNIYPYSQRSLKITYPNIEHHFSPGISTVYVQVKTRDPFIVPISILTTDDVYKYGANEQGIKMFIYGIIVAMILYHLILFLNIRLKYYAFYVLYLSSFLIMNMSYGGYTFEYLLQDSPVIQNWMQSTWIFLFSIAGLLFANAFLNLAKFAPKTQTTTNLMILFMTGTMIFSAFFGYHIHVILSIVLSVLFSFYVFTIGIWSLVNGNRTARFFILGTTAGLIGTTITALTVMSVLPYTHLGYQAIEFGLAIDSILLSFALVDRVKANEREKNIAEHFANTDALTQLLNRRAYNQICEEEQSGTHKIYRESYTVMMIDIDFFKKINDSSGHAAGDSVLDKIAKLLQSHIEGHGYLFRMGGEEFLALLPDFDQNLSEEFAEKIRATVEQTEFDIEDQKYHITVSIGISTGNASSTIDETTANA
ncbi:sensor domain-containing diguanylate cyclase, partial [Hydrogenovibrio marinus]